MAPPFASVSEFPDCMNNLLMPLHYREPALDSSSDSLTPQDSDISPNPTPKGPDIPSILAAQDSGFSSDPYLIHFPSQNELWYGRTYQGSDGTASSIDQVVSNATDVWPNQKSFFDGGFVGRPTHGLSLEKTELGQFSYMSAYEGFSSISDMATPELSYSNGPSSSNMTTASSAVDSGYGGSEEPRSEPWGQRRDMHFAVDSSYGGSWVGSCEGNEATRSKSPRWYCQSCDKSYSRQGNLLLHQRKKHIIRSETAKHVQQETEAQDDRMARSLQSTLGKVSPLPHTKDDAHPSSKDEAKLMNYQGYGLTDGSDDTRVSKKRENPDDDASHCSGAFSSEEGDDSDGECDNITTWNCSQRDALPSFLPYIRGHDADTSSPCGDSPDNGSTTSGSTTSGTTSDTPASSASGLTGGNGLQGNGYTSPSTGTGASNNNNNPILGINGTGPNFASDPQPLPLICWYSAAGIACTSKHVKMSIEVRHLWK